MRSYASTGSRILLLNADAAGEEAQQLSHGAAKSNASPVEDLGYAAARS